MPNASLGPRQHNGVRAQSPALPEELIRLPGAAEYTPALAFNQFWARRVGAEEGVAVSEV
jgi:hypothetical protein